MKIKDLKQAGNGKLLSNLKVEEAVAKNGNPFLKMNFDDGSDKAVVLIWSNDSQFETYKAFTKEGNLLVEAEMEFISTNSNGYDEFKIHGITKKERMSTFDCVEIEELINDFRDIVKNMKDAPLKKLTYTLLHNRELLNKLFEAPATEKSAYSFKGGLLAHIVRVCKCAEALASVYNNWNYNKNNTNEKINVDLLIVCAIFHDIGKIETYYFDNETVKKTFKGELLEDSCVSNQILRDTMAKCELSEEQKVLIEHAVSSSKGTLSFGALNTPRTKEANVFHLLERIDVMMGNFEYMQRISFGENEFQRLFDKNYCILDFKDV